MGRAQREDQENGVPGGRSEEQALRKTVDLRGAGLREGGGQTDALEHTGHPSPSCSCQRLLKVRKRQLFSL